MRKHKRRVTIAFYRSLVVRMLGKEGLPIILMLFNIIERASCR